jgi:hypothetical protein
MSDEDTDDSGFVPFDIVAIHENRTPQDAAPFHAPGGRWTFLDCCVARKPGARFTVGLLLEGDSGQPSMWGKAVLAVVNRRDGAAVLRAFAAGFFTDVPEPRLPRRPIEPLHCGTANLSDLGRTLEVDSGTEDTNWVRLKWFLEMDRFSAEVFFVFNLTNRRGSFSEKDTDYRDDLLGILALVTRDGPRPPRTPATDPNLTEDGPRIVDPRPILDTGFTHAMFTPSGRHLVLKVGRELWAIDPAAPDQRTRLAEFDNPIHDVNVCDEGPTLLVQEGIQQDQRWISSDDPKRIWLLQHGKKARRLRGVEKGLGQCEQSLSPDHRFVALTGSRQRTDNPWSYSIIYLLDLRARKTHIVDVPNESLTIVGWRGSSDKLRAILVTNRWQTRYEHAPKEVYLADPKTGRRTKAREAADILARLEGVSPDGRWQIQTFEDDEGSGAEFLITELATGDEREFTFHEDDAPWVHAEALEWIDSRYLRFHARRFALIDVETLKMSFPAPLDVGCTTGCHVISPDLAWAVYERKEGEETQTMLARVERPATG